MLAQFTKLLNGAIGDRKVVIVDWFGQELLVMLQTFGRQADLVVGSDCHWISGQPYKEAWMRQQGTGLRGPIFPHADALQNKALAAWLRAQKDPILFIASRVPLGIVKQTIDELNAERPGWVIPTCVDPMIEKVLGAKMYFPTLMQAAGLENWLLPTEIHAVGTAPTWDKIVQRLGDAIMIRPEVHGAGQGAETALDQNSYAQGVEAAEAYAGQNGQVRYQRLVRNTVSIGLVGVVRSPGQHYRGWPFRKGVRNSVDQGFAALGVGMYENAAAEWTSDWDPEVLRQVCAGWDAMADSISLQSQQAGYGEFTGLMGGDWVVDEDTGRVYATDVQAQSGQVWQTEFNLRGTGGTETMSELYASWDLPSLRQLTTACYLPEFPWETVPAPTDYHSALYAAVQKSTRVVTFKFSAPEQPMRVGRDINGAWQFKNGKLVWHAPDVMNAFQVKPGAVLCRFFPAAGTIQMPVVEVEDYTLLGRAMVIGCPPIYGPNGLNETGQAYVNAIYQALNYQPL